MYDKKRHLLINNNENLKKCKSIILLINGKKKKDVKKNYLAWKGVHEHMGMTWCAHEHGNVSIVGGTTHAHRCEHGDHLMDVLSTQVYMLGFSH